MAALAAASVPAVADHLRLLLRFPQQGLLLDVVVHAASIQDADGAGDLLRRIKPLYCWLRTVFTGGGYNCKELTIACPDTLGVRVGRLRAVHLRVVARDGERADGQGASRRGCFNVAWRPGQRDLLRRCSWP